LLSFNEAMAENVSAENAIKQQLSGSSIKLPSK